MASAFIVMDLPLSIEECDGSEDKLNEIGEAILTAKMVQFTQFLYMFSSTEYSEEILQGDGNIFSLIDRLC
jgi:hypothetical protein